MELCHLLEKLDQGKRLGLEEWVYLAETLPSDDLFSRADKVRRQHHSDSVVTYVVDRNINYTNVCDAVCTFCAFYRKPGSEDGYVLSHEEIFRKVEETIHLGGSGILLQGGLHPGLPLSYYEDLLQQLKRRYGIYLHCFSPPEIYYLAELYDISVEELLRRLQAAGLDSLPGGGAEILVDEVRRKVSTKCSGTQWLEVMRIAHQLGIPSTATMMYGIGEQVIHRFRHLQMIRDLQDETHGFVSFIPWTFQPDHTALGRKIPGRINGGSYLRWLALSRLALDNVPNIQVSWLTQGIEVGKQGLAGGANDLGSIMIEENVISAAGSHFQASEKILRESIIEAGFIPCKRNAGYQRLENPVHAPNRNQAAD